MVRTNKSDNSCSLGGDILAYVYDELSPDVRERFESHLESCPRCIDEFAELSDARYSVYEWKNVEFAPLETPRFVIPTERVPAAGSWIDAVRAVFAWNGAAALVGGLAILIFGIFGFSLIYDPAEPSIAENVETAPMVTASSEIIVPSSNSEDTRVEVSERDSVPARRTVAGTTAVRKQPETIKTKTVRNAPADPEQGRITTANRRLESSPTLSQYAEDSDESLRLSDIFDDLDSRELD
jgi:hypothetical protein